MGPWCNKTRVFVRRGRDTASVHTERKATWGHRKKAAVCTPWREASGEPQPAGTLILDFKPRELWENKSLLCKPPNLWSFVMTVRAGSNQGERWRHPWRGEVSQETSAKTWGLAGGRAKDPQVTDRLHRLEWWMFPRAEELRPICCFQMTCKLQRFWYDPPEKHHPPDKILFEFLNILTSGSLEDWIWFKKEIMHHFWRWMLLIKFISTMQCINK